MNYPRVAGIHIHWSNLTAARLRPAFIFVYIFDSDHGAKAHHQPRNVQRIDMILIEELPNMLQQLNPDFQTLRSPTKLTLLDLTFMAF